MLNRTNLKGAYSNLVYKTSLMSVSALALIFSFTPGVHAQSVDEGVEMDEVIVTARKKEESLQEVPLSISAFTEDDIQKRSLTQLEGLALQTPGLTFEEFSGGYGAPVIRGASQIRIDQLQQNVSVFYDGIYMPRQYAFDLGMTNVDRIEVVKGPQSALYGANSFAGAINYVSKSRNLNSFEGSVEGGVGTDGLLEANAYVNIPIVEDMLAVSLLGAHSQFDGDWDNDHPNADRAPSQGTDESLGGWDKDTYGLGVTFEKGNFSADLDYMTFNAEGEDTPHYRITEADGDFNCSPIEEPPFFGAPFTVTSFRGFCGTLPNSNITNPSGVDGLLIDPRSYSETETEMIRAQIGYDISDNISLSYLYGDVKGDAVFAAEATRDPLQPFFLFIGGVGLVNSGNVFSYAPTGSFDYKTHEAKADFDFGNGITALAGVFLLDGRDTNAFAFAPTGVAGFLGVDPLVNPNTPGDDTNTETRAIFASVNIPFMDDRLNVSLEGRYTDDTISANDGGVNFDYETSSFTPRATIDFQLTENSLLYGSVAQGIKSGGVNTSSVALTDDERFFDDDENVTFEIGSKNTLLDGRATLNVALFHLDWENLQASKTPEAATNFTSAIVENIGGARSQGIEVDGTIDLTDSFALNAGLSYTDAEYTDGAASGSKSIICDAVATADTVCLNNADGQAIIDGNTVARVPELQWNIGAQFDGSIGSDIDFFVRGDVTGQSEQFASELNLAEIESRNLVNLRSGISKGNISADIWVTNLFDEEYVASSFYVANPFSNDHIATFGAKRRAGVTLSYDF